MTTSEQHALYNLMTRPEPTENWRKSMNGIIGSINQGSFQVVFHTGNNPLTTDQPVPVVPVEPIAQPQKNPPITTTTNDPTLGNRPIGQISLVTDFENFGAWHRGDEAWGTFSQSAEQSTSGQYSGKFVYNFPAVENNYIIFQHTINIGRPDALQVQVYGDGSTHFLNLWVQDASGQIWQFTFGRINHVGWQPMLAPLDLGLGWPNQAVGNTSAPAMTYPLRFYAVVLDGHASNQSFSGAIYIDDLMAVTFADSPNGVPINESPALPVDPSTSAPPQSTATVTSPTLNVRSGPGATFQVVGKVQKGQVLSVLERDAATGWLRVETPVGIGWVSGNFVKLAK